jgi:hypothetical protein
LSFGAVDDLDMSDGDDLAAAPLEVEAMTQVSLAEADSGIAPLDADDDENAETLPPVHDAGEEEDAPAVTSILLSDGEPEGAPGDATTRVLFAEADEGAASDAPEVHRADPFADLIGGERGPRRDLAPTDLGDPFADEPEAPLAPAASATVVMAGFDETDPFDAALPTHEPPAARSAPPAPERELPAAALPSRDELRNLLEKMAWEAFGDVTDRIVRETVQRVEQIAWEVIPKMAETLIREEIRKLKESDEP